jgi:GT2 family glycosyltransferase
MADTSSVQSPSGVPTGEVGGGEVDYHRSEGPTVPPAPDVSVIVVNWNAGEHLEACVAGLERGAAGVTIETIIVDNDSSDESIERAMATGRVDRLLRNQENLGFTVANNQGARAARGHLMLFLNPDALVMPGALKTLVRQLERHPRIGVLAPRLTDEAGHSSRDMGNRLPTPFTVANSFLLLSRISPSLFPGMTRDTDVRGLETCEWACGAALLVRREVWERIGWNEELFLHGEDIDFCARVREAGWEIAVTSDAEVRHLGGRSLGRQTQRSLLAATPSGIATHLRRHSSPVGATLAITAMHVGMRMRYLAHATLYRLTGDPARLRKARKLRLFLAQDRGGERQEGGARAAG